jgi:hypothetical protein
MHLEALCSPKRRLTYTGPHGISQRTNLSSSAADKHSNIVNELYEIEFQMSRKYKTGSTVDSSALMMKPRQH